MTFAIVWLKVQYIDYVNRSYCVKDFKTNTNPYDNMLNYVHISAFGYDRKVSLRIICINKRIYYSLFNSILKSRI